MSLDSDVPNPNSHLHRVFYSREVKNAFLSAAKSNETGKDEIVNERIDYIRISIPGNKNLEIDTPVREEHKKRFPMEWLAYQASGLQRTSVVGTPIEQWPRVVANPDMAQELRHIKFSTIQSIAGASDAQLQSIGMIAGQNAFTFRDDARQFLATTEAESKLSDADKKHAEANSKLAEANAKMLEQAEQHAKDMAEMKAQMNELLLAATSYKTPHEPQHDQQQTIKRHTR